MRVLVVEDQPKIAEAIRRGLVQEGYAVDVVHTGDQGLAYASTEPYDLIVLDRMLPGSLDGEGVVRELRVKSVTTPVLMLTARTAIVDRVSGLSAGADDYLTKPFAFEELVARLQALARRPQSMLQQATDFGDLRIDFSSYTVQRKGVAVDLSQREFRLLEYLARNVNQVVSKEQIIGHVWDFDADVLPNTVEVYIGYLRRKLEKPFGGQLIHTVRGFGYRFTPL